MSNERFQPSDRVRTGSVYRNCYRRGRRARGRGMQLFFAPGDRSLRLGITASRKVGNAVVRHRLKRQIREVYRRSQWRHELRGDLVVNLYQEAAEMGFHEVEQALSSAVVSLRSNRRRSRRSKRSASGSPVPSQGSKREANG